MNSRIHTYKKLFQAIIFSFIIVLSLWVNYLFAATNKSVKAWDLILDNSKSVIKVDNKTSDKNNPKEELLFDTEEKNEEESTRVIDETKKDSVKTIKELEDNIEDLEVDKKVLSVKFNNFIEQRGELKVFFKEQLTSANFVIIEQAITAFNSEKQILEQSLQIEAEKWNETDYITMKLIENKKVLYASLRQFIKSDKLSAYDNYVQTDVSVTQRDSKIDSNIYKKKEILHNKVSTIKEKIKESETELQQKVNQAVAEKVGSKLNAFLDNPLLEKLSKEKQRMIFQRVLNRIIEIKKEKMSWPISLKIQKKIMVYVVIEDVLRKFISDNFTL